MGGRPESTGEVHSPGHSAYLVQEEEQNSSQGPIRKPWRFAWATLKMGFPSPRGSPWFGARA